MIDTFTCWRDPNHEVKPHPDFGWPQCIECNAAPAYHQRPQWLPRDLALGIYLPKPGSAPARIIDAGSGIVGLPTGVGLTRLYYEGWRTFLPSDLRGKPAYAIWHGAMGTAASRMVTAYPTMATATVPDSEVLRIGSYWVTSALFEIDDEHRTAHDEWIASSRHVPWPCLDCDGDVRAEVDASVKNGTFEFTCPHCGFVDHI